MSVKLTLFTKENCCLCVEAKEILEQLHIEKNIIIEEIDIYSDDDLLEEYQLMIPVIKANGKMIAFGKIQKKDILSAIK
jgi:glutaredoxin